MSRFPRTYTLGAVVTEKTSHLNVGDLESLTVEVEGTVASDIVNVLGSNDDGYQSAISNEEQVGADLTADSITEITPIPRWIRFNREAVGGGGGDITLIVHGRPKAE